MDHFLDKSKRCGHFCFIERVDLPEALGKASGCFSTPLVLSRKGSVQPSGKLSEHPVDGTSSPFIVVLQVLKPRCLQVMIAVTVGGSMMGSLVGKEASTYNRLL